MGYLQLTHGGIDEVKKKLTNEEMINKLLRCLNKTSKPKVIAIIESKVMKTIDLSTLFANLKEHEI
ncbi:hypothetical protein CR513_59520, partial [Mucuna pruriens]